MSESDRVVRVIVSGRVQGVGYRAWTHHQAELHGLRGWVRNRSDGTVEAVLAGRSELVDTLIKALREGPRGASVDSLDVAPADPSLLDFVSGFELRSTT